MRTFVEGQDITVAVSFQRDGEPFVPDGGAFTYDLRGQDGSLLQTGVSVSNVADTFTNIVVSAAQNGITAPHEFEKRTLVLKATVDGQPWTTNILYRLCQWLNMTATKDDVRAFIGVGSGELPDCDIDLIAAYWDCASFMDTDTTPFFENALVAGDETERQANRAIVAQAVLLVMSSLQARISQMETDGTKEAQRFPIDFGDLEDRASNQLSRAINIITSRPIITPLTIAVAPTPDPLFPFRPRYPWFR